jgi:hypothetical protein
MNSDDRLQARCLVVTENHAFVVIECNIVECGHGILSGWFQAILVATARGF